MMSHFRRWPVSAEPTSAPTAHGTAFRGASTTWRARITRPAGNTLAADTLRSIGDAVVTTDLDGRVTYLNPVAERLLGWRSQDAVGRALDVVMTLQSESSRHPIANLALRCLAEGRTIDLEDGVVLVRPDGTEVPIGDSAAPIRNRMGETMGVVLVIQDESEKRRIGHQLSYEATHDALTGLPNRREFDRRLTLLIASTRDAAATHVLLYLDLDRFKAVNDACGHDAGDALLRNLGPRISRHLRSGDTLARVGGDEFGVLLEDCPLQDADRIANDIRLELEEWQFQWAGAALSVGVSIGLLPLTAAGGELTAVVRAADAACYAAKVEGGGRVHQSQWRTVEMPFRSSPMGGVPS